MILAEHRHQQPRSDEFTSDSQQIALTDNASSWQSSNANSNNNNNNNNTIEETAVVHRQPDNNRQIADIDDDDEEDNFTYPSSDDDDDDEDDGKSNWVAKKLPETPQPSVNTTVSKSNKVNISTTNKNVYEGNVVIHQTFYNNQPGQTSNHNSIDVGLPDKSTTAEKDPEAAVGPKLSNVSSHPLYPFSKDKVSNWCTKKRLIAISGAVLVAIAIIVLSVYLTNSGTTKPAYVPTPPNDTSINNDPTFPGVCFVPRIEWTAQPAKEPAKALAVSPAKYVIISHTATVSCFLQAQCSSVVRQIQKNHMDEQNKTDIGYNFLVGGDGLIYHGRGWNSEGDHTKNYDNKSIGLAFIGSFNSDSPTKAQIANGQKAIKLGVDSNKISKDYVLVGQRQCIKSSDSPGKILYDVIKQWDHWSPACY